jgi:hypothetical protein
MKTSLTGEFIERAPKRIDTRGEKDELSLAKIKENFWGKARKGFGLW